MTDPSSTVHTAAPLERTWENDPLNHVIRAFIAFLQSIYEVAPEGAFRWAPDETTQIIITEENPINMDEREQRPAISVILGAVRFNGSSLDDLVSIDATNAEEVHTDLIPGTMSLNHVSRVPHEARFLAWLTARTIWNLRKLFIKESHIHDVGRNIQMGPVTPAGALVQGDTEGEWHSVMVNCPFFLQWTDTVRPLKHDWNGRPIHPLRQIGMSFQTRMGEAQPNLTHTQDAGRRFWGTQAPRSPRYRGKEIKRDPQPGSTSSPLDVEFKV